MMNAGVGVSRFVHHWEYDSRQVMGHVCIINELDSRYMDSPDLTSYFKNVSLGRHDLVKEFQCESDNGTKDFIQGITRPVCEKLEDRKLQQPLLEVVVGKFAELPQEILLDIFALLDTPDLVRAGSVCGSWNSAYSSICSFGQCKWPQTPCLIYTSESADDNVAFLHSLAEKRVYKLTLPEPPIHRRYLIGSSNGWLVTADERSEMHLVNPITSEQISLPSVTTIEQVTPILDENGILCKYWFSMHTADSVLGPSCTYSLSTLRDHLFHKAHLFFDTSTESYMVVLIHNPFGQLSFARLGDEKWTWLPPHSNFEDCIYKDNLLYAVTLLGQIITFDVSGSVVTTKIIMDRKDSYGVERVYIVQDPLGDLLLVRRPEVWLDTAFKALGSPVKRGLIGK
ncbi:hypothetical protein HU200_025623 [Digitaria exilis]|uniref:F-box domain-containing protein n=1 Tax=Digitaria exilis TaxID=1010633 RepID=A0A835C4X3_9POAL|nr:hypothetical protein HU200_025623 [Digitaria exilis]